MNNNIRIKCFIRLDQAMMDLLLPVTVAGYHVENHWMFWTIRADNLPEEVDTWLKAQPEDSWARVSYVDTFSQLMLDSNGSRIAIGISLSEITPEQIRQLLNGYAPLSMMTVSIDSSYTPTKNPYLFTCENRVSSMSYLYVPTGTGLKRAEVILPQVSELEQKFMASLEGHDFFYEYSDSLSVWKAGKADEERLKAEGVAMGISKKDVDRLYTEKYKELMKR